MKKWIYISVMFFSVSVLAQVQIGNDFMDTYRSLGSEHIFVHQNTDLIVTGEQFQYSVYCLQADERAFSSLSQIAYLKLVQGDKTLLLQKVKLKEGVGSGDFTIPAELATGNYKIIAYTQWMRNFGADYFYQADLKIVNPYTFEQTLEKTDGLVQNQGQVEDARREETAEVLKLSFNSDKVGTREKFQVQVMASHNPTSYGNYTMSVRQLNPFEKPTTYTPSVVSNQYPSTAVASFENNLVYVPEINGELITGTVLSSNHQKPVKKMDLAFSMPGAPNLFKISASNSLGVFYFDVPEAYQHKRAIIEPLSSSDEQIKIQVAPKARFNLETLKFPTFSLTENEMAWLHKRSIDSQIENAYFAVKNDALVPPVSVPEFYSLDYNYDLDDFKRFPTVVETLVEVVDHVYTTTKRGKRIISIRDYQNKTDRKLNPLILIDGVFIQDHDDFLNFSVSRIKSIGVIVDKFLYDNHYFEGVLIVSTFDGNYEGNPQSTSKINLQMQPVEPEKNYYQPNYEDAESLRRIPDVRTQLLWVPQLKLDKPQEVYSFYTGDNEGWFELCIQGFTFSGKPVSIRKRFQVKQRSDD